MSKHKELIEMMSNLEKAEIPYAIASVFSVQGSSSGKIGDKALFNEKGKRIIGYVGGGCIENRVASVAKESLSDGNPKIIDIDLDGMGRVVEVLCQIASLLKFKVVVQAPKDEENRFADANQVITEPLEMEDIDFKVDYFILATHHRDDDKIAYEALKKGIPYVGVVASAKKTSIIMDYLFENGLNKDDLNRFYSPTGLDLKAATAEEIALSIMCEIVMLRNNGSGHPMRAMIETKESKIKS